MQLLIRFVAILLALAGLAALVASVGAFVFLPADSAARALVMIVVQAALVCTFLGGAALYTARTGRVFPGETEGAPILPTIVRLVIALGLIALPAWMVLQLQPFIARWREVVDLTAGSRMWTDASANFGGYVFVPMAVVLTPPIVELVTMAGFIVASVALLVRVFIRRPGLSRWYVAWSLVLSALAFASARAAAATAHAALVTQRALERSDRPGDEFVQVMAFVQRYTSDVNTAAAVLAWTLLGYAVLLSIVWISERRFHR